MANPLTMLDLKPRGFQFIQEVPVNATPKKTWAALLNFPGWFAFDPSNRPKVTIERRVGGRFMTRSRDGNTSLHGTITYMEPGKLLRFAGQMGMTHVPIMHVFIWELQPQNNGKTTLLRFGQRSFGYMDDEVEKRMQQGWGKLLPNIKELAERSPSETKKK